MCKNSHRVIFRVIGQELHIATGEVKTLFFRFCPLNFDPKTSTTQPGLELNFLKVRLHEGTLNFEIPIVRLLHWV
jgi:hypothetical protein